MAKGSEKTGRRKKGVVYAVIAAMLCAAVYLNWNYVQTPNDLITVNQNTAEDLLTSTAADAETSAEVVSGEDYFAQSRLSRERARDEAISLLKNALQDDKSDDEAKKIAADQISAYADRSVDEARVESLIKAKGYPETVVFLSDDSVNVIVKPKNESIEKTDAAVIQDIVTSETAYTVAQIRIVEAAV